MSDLTLEEINIHNVSYKEWMDVIDDLLFEAFHVVQDDLPDWMSRDAYNSGMSAVDAYSEILSITAIEDIG